MFTSMLRQLSFLFDCAIKSAALWLIEKNKVKVSPRERYPAEFHFNICELIHDLTTKLVEFHHELSSDVSQNAVISISYFMQRLLNLVDRYTILNLVHVVAIHLDSIDSRIMRRMRLFLLQAIAFHEHFIPLSLPIITTKAGDLVPLIGLQTNSSPANIQQTSEQLSKKRSGFLSKFMEHIFSIPSTTGTLQQVN